MNLDFLAKLLLQHDDSPFVGSHDLNLHLMNAAEEGRVKPGVAVALDQRLVIAQQQGQAAGGAAGSQGGIASLEFANVLKAPETVSSLAWLASPGQPADDCLLVGTSTGFLQVHALTGATLHRQDLHEGPLTCISVRLGGMGTDPGDLSEDITVCAPDAVMRLTLLDIRAVVRWQKGAQGRGWWGAAPVAPTLSLAKWQLPRGTGPRSFAISLGSAPPSLYSMLAGRESGEKSQIFTTGAGPPLATLEAGRCFELIAFKRLGQSEVVASKLVDESNGGGLFSLISRAREALPIGLPSRPSLLGGRSKGKEERAKIKGSSASLAASVWDEKRAVTRVSMSPCGTLAACCDNLGRVLLVDTAATLVIRMLKGYRDAQVAWLLGPAGLQQRRRHRHSSRQQQHQQQLEEDGEEEVQSVRRGPDELGLHGQQGRAEQAQQGAGREDTGSAAAGSSREDWEARWSDSDESVSVSAAEASAPEQQQGPRQGEVGHHFPAHPAAGDTVSKADSMGNTHAPDSSGEIRLSSAVHAAALEFLPVEPGAELLHQQPKAAEEAAIQAAGMQTQGPSAASLAGSNQAGSSFSALPDLDEPLQLAATQPVQPAHDNAPPAEVLGPLLVIAGQHGQQVGAGGLQVQRQGSQQDDAGTELPQSPSGQRDDARQQLYVVVYAPRRAAVELWQPHSGRRAAAVRYQSQHAVLLQQPIRPPQQTGPQAGPRSSTGIAELSAAHNAAAREATWLEASGGAAVLASNSVWMLDLESLQLLDLRKLLLGL
ncbi:hypothetical protein N2152v2_005211 [Parachlorella kessleri]